MDQARPSEPRSHSEEEEEDDEEGIVQSERERKDDEEQDEAAGRHEEPLLTENTERTWCEERQACPSEPRSDSEEGIGQSEHERKGRRGTRNRNEEQKRPLDADAFRCCRNGPRRDQARPSKTRSDSKEGIGQSERERKGQRRTRNRNEEQKRPLDADAFRCCRNGPSLRLRGRRSKMMRRG
ncbi:hypothetical protein D9C73_027461 [Collichthys lucidus]|uniref:Uncharacterized protein n=1 Tax=Collichthys lucidus TaxID=240159 RepID=A0A4U5VUW5_COLLU|nr:hypothetical protein D9C73_027461 [Collichthys lucidus]